MRYAHRSKQTVALPEWCAERTLLFYFFAVFIASGVYQIGEDQARS